MDCTIWFISDVGDGKVRVRNFIDDAGYDIKAEDKDIILHAEALIDHLSYLDDTYPMAKFEMD